ncbi:MAG: hypothetical protein WBB85_01325 [Albidovulum sp.]|uniref:hypothetical protein n=1 Tax=Albidovulum sp. TaxID=1872424 RepID=UPI003CAF77DE
MSTADRKVHIAATITAGEVEESRMRARALAQFPSEVAGLTAIIRQVATEHPAAADDLDKVATALEVGSHFAHECSERLWVIFAGAQLHEIQGKVQ